MTKKPFAVRIDEETTMRFKALATIKDQDNATLFSILVNEHVQTLSKEEEDAFEALLHLW